MDTQREDKGDEEWLVHFTGKCEWECTSDGEDSGFIVSLRFVMNR